MTKIKRFIECLIPITTCNLRCSYCYVIQRNNRCNKIAKLKYTPEQIGNCLTVKRGVVAICGLLIFSIWWQYSGLNEAVFADLKQIIEDGDAGETYRYMGIRE